MSGGAIEVAPVAGRADREAFRRLPFRLYRDDPHWVPPLNRDIRAFLSSGRHPFSRSGTIAFFLARRRGRVVGRIAAIENRAHNAFHRDRTGFFGFFEAEPDPDVAAALVARAEAWLAERGLETLRGPFSPSTNYESGLLVGGDPGLPALMMPHNPPYYARHLEACGFTKAMDLLAFHLHKDVVDVERWQRLDERVRSRLGVTIRELDLRRFAGEVRLITEIYHEAWSGNWGFVPMNEAEIRVMAKELRPLIAPWLGAFVVKDGREIGFHLGLPDYNRVLHRLRGRLLPFGIVRLLRARTRLPFMRLLLMGVRKEHQGLGVDALLYQNAVRRSLENGIPACEASWILETNRPMIHAMERAGARHYRTYRVYEKPIGSR